MSQEPSIHPHSNGVSKTERPDPEVVPKAKRRTFSAAYKLRVLDEKHVLKRVARDLVPPDVFQRKKQPYRAPDALSFVGADAPGWIADALSEPSRASA